ncbi:hypothetical protein HW452_01695 [Halomonas aquamarina]|uniref:Uncharacterized protein n=1 Tax=Vreelandella aquamarina TaxID=77097 RepID=A0ACC5VQP9_9GAMM|nr:hypothetical protein [Halomonas aquamarina]MBZ5486239.1 hypothetical protein [Halomonas aquamarina]
MNKTLSVILIGAAFTGMSLSALADDTSGDDRQAAQQDGMTSGQLRSMDDAANQGQESGNNDDQDQPGSTAGDATGSQGPQQGQDERDLDMDDQTGMNRELQEEQRGRGNSKTQD